MFISIRQFSTQKKIRYEKKRFLFLISIKIFFNNYLLSATKNVVSLLL